MKRIVYLLALFSAPVFAECTACGCSEGCSACDINGIVDVITNAAQNACSSNCVKMTPAECVVLKDSINSNVFDIEHFFNEFKYELNSAIDVLSTSLSFLSVSVSHLDEVIENAESVNYTNQTVVSYSITELEDVLSRLSQFTNYWSSISIGSDGNLKVLFISNTVSHVSQTINPRNQSYPLRFSNVAVSLITDVISQLQLTGQLDTSLLVNAKHSVSYVISDIENAKSTLESLKNSSSVSSIEYDLEALRLLNESISCDSCGTGSGTDSGTGSSPSVPSVDFSPIVSELQLIRQRIDYQLDRIYDLIKRLFQDYNSAAESPVTGRVNLSTLGSDKNWFSRIEKLLYNSADIPSNLFSDYDSARSVIPSGEVSEYGSGASANNWFIRVEQLLGMIASPKSEDVVGADTNPTSPPEDMEESDKVKDLDRAVEQNEPKVETQKTAIDNSLKSGWNKIRQSLTEFGNNLRRFSFSETNIDGMSLEMTIETEDGTVDLFQVPRGASAMLSKVRIAFNVFWLLLCLVLYIYSFKLFFGLILAYISWFVKLSASTFGG